MNNFTNLSVKKSQRVERACDSEYRVSLFCEDLKNHLKHSFDFVRLEHKSSHPEDTYLYMGLAYDELTEDYIVVGLWNASQRIIRDVKFADTLDEAEVILDKAYMDCYEEYEEEFDGYILEGA